MSYDKTIAVDPSSKNLQERCLLCNGILMPDPADPSKLRCSVCNFIKKNHQEIQAGSVVCNKYRILTTLGSGGGGSLFLCHPVDDLKTRYVLKTLKNSNMEAKKRFQREALLLRNLNDERIVRVLDFLEDDRNSFIIMEYVNGKNLRQVSEDFTFDEESVLIVLHEVAAALYTAWDTCKVIHRDIKPENIMLDSANCIKLLDFGLSKSMDEDNNTDITLEKSVLGTPGFMSPEQFSDFKHVDFRADMFSLGATAYFLLTGEKPFKEENLTKLYQETMKNSPPPAEKLAPYCSDQTVQIIRKMMNADRDARYATYAELLAELDGLLNQAPNS